MLSRASLVVAALVLAPLLAGCGGSDDSSPGRSAGPTPIAKLDVARLRLVRAEFCDRVPEPAVRAALGHQPDTDESWGNGDPVPGSADNGSVEVGHELGCGWTGAAGTAARAWVFARPVSADFADALVRSPGQGPECSGHAATVFGQPGMLEACSTGTTSTLRRAGLFGDSWLTCEVTVAPRPGSDSIATDKTLRARLDPWCAEVVATLDAP